MKWVVLLWLLRFVIQINVSFERSSPEVHVSTVDLMQMLSVSNSLWQQQQSDWCNNLQLMQEALENLLANSSAVSGNPLRMNTDQPFGGNLSFASGYWVGSGSVVRANRLTSRSIFNLKPCKRKSVFLQNLLFPTRLLTSEDECKWF